jgi:ABC-2 type transport system ATP-binding protein
VNDFGQVQEVRLKGDPQSFLARQAARTAIYHFEVTRPSLQDIFVRIAKPREQELSGMALENRSQLSA